MGWNKDNLKKAFAKAGLVLEFAKESFARGKNAEDVFGLDIRRKTPNRADSEFFLMWPGHEDNTVTIRDTDKEFGQVILTIQEPEREFEETVDKFSLRARLNTKEGKADPTKAISSFLNHFRGYPKLKRYSPKSEELVIIQRTPKDSRTFLLGMDERQLFMTQVNRNINTVKAAHASLKTPAVTFFEGKADGKTIRQGEWFFVNIPENERETLENAIKKNLVSPVKKVPIGNYAGRSGGKPHTADELISTNLDFSESGMGSQFIEHSVGKNTILAHGATDAGLGEMLAANHLTTADIVKWNPTTPELIVRMPKKGRRMTSSPRISGRNDIYVRGAVTHLDHKTVKFSQWRKVIANTETATGSARSTGGSWID